MTALGNIGYDSSFRMTKAQNDDDFEKRRSQAAIRAQAKKELEKEQQIQNEVEKLRDTYAILRHNYG